MRLVAILSLSIVAAAALSCANPVHTDAVAAQGGDSSGEFNGISPGPTHRAGQQCMVCHGGDGPGPNFSFAGTIYITRGQPDPAVNATISITDENNQTHDLISNDVGNFYITKDDWDAEMPANVKVSWTDSTGRKSDHPMISRIGNNGGCATCHYGLDNQLTHMPPVYVREP